MQNTILSSTNRAKVISIVSTKGGVGKTTTAANLGAVIADAGKKVLLIDLDTQPTLSSYFALEDEKQKGTYELVAQGDTSFDNVSKTNINNLDILISNDFQSELNDLGGSGLEVRLITLLEPFKTQYDLILIDTQGTRSLTLKMAILAADTTISPVPPEMLAAREFGRGTVQLFKELQEAYLPFGIKVPIVNLFINRADFTSTDSRLISDSVRESFSNFDNVRVLNTVIPSIAVYRKAATEAQPAHRYETKRPHGRKAPSALETMTELAKEVFPEWVEELSTLSPETIKSIAGTEVIQEA